MKQHTPLQRVLDWVEENKKQIETAYTILDFVSVRDLRAFIESIKEEENIIKSVLEVECDHEWKTIDAGVRYCPKCQIESFKS